MFSVVHKKNSTNSNIPYVDTAIKWASRQVSAIRTKRDRIHRLRVLAQRVQTLAALYVPQAYGRIKASTRQYKIWIWILCARSRRTPLDSVDLLVMCLQVVQTVVTWQRPYLESHVIWTWCKQFALRIPFDCVYFVLMALKGLDRLKWAESAHVDFLVCAAWRKARFVLPVDVERRCCMKRKLLCARTGLSLPYNSCLARER